MWTCGDDALCGAVATYSERSCARSADATGSANSTGASYITCAACTSCAAGSAYSTAHIQHAATDADDSTAGSDRRSDGGDRYDIYLGLGSSAGLLYGAVV